MKYAIMCGGKYNAFYTPRQLLKINNEPIVARTIRLLKAAGASDICITATDSRFDGLGVPRLEHKNTFEAGKALKGYWLDAFYPFTVPVTYIFGDVYFTEDAINQIVNYKAAGNILFGSKIATNKLGKNWGEPFAYIVNDVLPFFDGIAAVKQMQDEGKTARHPIVWELYRYLNGFDVNVQRVSPETFKVIDDITKDVDSYEEYEKIKAAVENGT